MWPSGHLQPPDLDRDFHCHNCNGAQDLKESGCRLEFSRISKPVHASSV
jgi:hypothetical protein